MVTPIGKNGGPRAQRRRPAAWLSAALILLGGVLALSAEKGKDGAAKPTAPKDKAEVSTPVASRISDGQRDFCHMVIRCGLTLPKGYCPDSASLGSPKFTYDSARCLEGRQLQARGVGPDHPRVGYRLYRFLGMEYRVIYTVEDQIPISAGRLAYLLQDLPLAAKLITHYRKQPYVAQYSDLQHKSFTGTKGKHLRGEATLISGDVEEKHLFYFGTGVAEVAWWVLKGPALMDFRYESKDAKSVHYTMKVLVFPGNGFINKIMNLGLFRKIVLSKVREVLEDITETAKAMAKTNGQDVLKASDFTPDEKARVQAFLKIP